MEHIERTVFSEYCLEYLFHPVFCFKFSLGHVTGLSLTRRSSNQKTLWLDKLSYFQSDPKWSQSWNLPIGCSLYKSLLFCRLWKLYHLMPRANVTRSSRIRFSLMSLCLSGLNFLEKKYSWNVSKGKTYQCISKRNLWLDFHHHNG